MRALVVLVSLLVVGSLFSTAAAITPCSTPTDRYIAYNSEFTNSHIPRLGDGINGPWVGCYTDQFLANYNGIAVGQIKVHDAPPGYFSCEAYSVKVVNGSYQWGPTASGGAGSDIAKQSLIVGNVLLMQVKIFSALAGVNSINVSMFNNPDCYLW